MKKGLLIVLSGPSGAGKGTVYNAVIQKMPQLKKSISVTTRSPRVGETEGVHYYFKSVEEYDRMKSDGEFLETARYTIITTERPKLPCSKCSKKATTCFSK